MFVAKISPMSGQVNQLDLPITQDAYEVWRAGELIQNVLPNLTPVEREFLITGYTPEEQELLFDSIEKE